MLRLLVTIFFEILKVLALYRSFLVLIAFDFLCRFLARVIFQNLVGEVGLFVLVCNDIVANNCGCKNAALLHFD